MHFCYIAMNRIQNLSFEENSTWQNHKINGGSLCLSNLGFGWHWSYISFICGV